MSGGDNAIIGIDFADDLGVATITGTPVVTGVNCTATYVSHTPAGVVSVRINDGEYAGAVQVSVTLTDGRTPGREVSLRFL
jgi:hypothetical protein